MKINVAGTTIDSSEFMPERPEDQILRVQENINRSERALRSAPLANARCGGELISEVLGSATRFDLTRDSDIEIIDYDGRNSRTIAGQHRKQMGTAGYNHVFAACGKRPGFYAIDHANQRVEHYAGDFNNQVLPRLRSDGFVA